MRRSAFFLLVAALAFPASLAATGCSLMGLDDLPQASCTSDVQCAALESVRPSGNACVVWQCTNPDESTPGICIQAAPDGDNDGATTSSCAAIPAAADCDDTRDEVHPGAGDQCDLLDNDCDGIVDDLFVASTASVVELGSNAGAVGFEPVSSSTVAITRIPGAAGTISQASIDIGSTALRDAFANVDADASERAVGTSAMLADGSTLLAYDPVVSAEDCGAAGTIQVRRLRPTASTQTVCLDDQTRLASASLVAEPDGDALLVWIDDAASRECGGAATAPVLARVLRSTSAGVVAGAILELGDSADALGPSVVHVAGQGWFVAHVEASGDVAIHRIVPQTTLASVTAEPIATVTSGSAAEVSLATNGSASTPELGIVFSEGGCAAANRVVVYTAAVGSTLELGTPIELHASADANRRNPVLAFHAARDERVVLYREASREVAQRLRADGTLESATFSFTASDPVQGRPLVLASGASWWFVARTTGGSIQAGSLSCSPEPAPGT